MAGSSKPAKESAETTTESAAAGSRRPSVSTLQARTYAAQAVWVVCLVAATSLAIAALCIAVDANQRNALVEIVLRLARFFDLGVFTLRDGIMAFSGDNAETKNALINYGLGAVFYLVVGRILERVIRP